MYKCPTKRPDKPLSIAEVLAVLQQYFLDGPEVPPRCIESSGRCVYAPRGNALGCAVGIFLTVEDAMTLDHLRGSIRQFFGVAGFTQAQEILRIYFNFDEQGMFDLLCAAQRVHDHGDPKRLREGMAQVIGQYKTS